MKGFTLLEMLVVLAIIGILAMAAIPANTGRVNQAAVAETIQLVKRYQRQVENYYDIHNEFPAENASIGMPEPNTIMGNYLAAAYLDNGALHLKFGNKIRQKLHGKIVSLRPIFNPATGNTPVSWVCGNDTVPANMIAAGENRTDIKSYNLPVSCR